MKLNLVEDINELDKPQRGDAEIVIGLKQQKQLIICCPGCGKLSSSRGNHIFSPETNTYHPSIVHDKKYGGCGWHGWLKNGIFTKC